MADRIHSKTAFTLIELLIVVAIIAILAAIAVPNFMEAQTRAKVSRVKSDLRSLATAQESYLIDYNSYTFRDQADDPTYQGGFRLLTSPVAYISTVPRDPFGYHKYPGNSGVNAFREPFYEMGCGNANNRQTTGKIKNPNPKGFPASIYMMCSAGPDKVDDTRGDQSIKVSEGQFPWPAMTGTAAEVAVVLALSYDTTNGTKSGGQVYRVGGSKPGGIVYDLLFQGGTQ